MPKIKNNRTRLKRRANGLYKTIIIVEDDPENTVATVEVSIAPQNDVTPTPEVIILQKKATNNGNTRYVNKHLLMEGEGDPLGKSFAIVATMKDIDGNTIDSPENIDVTAQDNDGINIVGVSLRMNADEQTFTFRTVIKGTNKAEVANVAVLLTPEEEGASVAEPPSFELTLNADKPTKKVFKNKSVSMEQANNVVDMSYLAAITLTDTDGNELDYAEFRIVGLE